MLISKTINEVVNDLISERTSPGDEITLSVTYEGLSKRPKMVLEFRTNDPDKRRFPSTEDISAYVPAWDEPETYGDGTPKESQSHRFSSWRELVSDTYGLKGLIESVARAQGVRFNFEEKS